MSRRIINIVVVVFACLLCTSLVVLFGRQYEKGIVENYYRKIEIAEEMIFDEPEIIEEYGEPIEILVGTRGTITDSIAYSGDLNGYDYIDATLSLDNGKYIRVAISFDYGIQKEIRPASEILSHPTEKYIIVFDISKIKLSQSVMEEYKLSRERYYSRVQKVRVISVVTCVVLYAIIGGTFCLVSKSKAKDDQN